MKKDSKHNYLQYFWRYRQLLFIATLLTAIVTISQLVNQQFLSRLVDSLSKGNASSIFTIAVIMLILTTIKICFTCIADKVFLKVNSNVVKNLHKKLAGTLADASSESVTDTASSVLAERLREGQNFVGSFMGIYFEAFNIFAGILALIYAFVCSWQIGLLFTVSLIIIYFIQNKMIERLINSKKEVKTASDKNRQLIIEIIDAFLAIKAQNLTFSLRNHFSKNLDQEFDASIQSKNIDISWRTKISAIRLVYQTVFLLLGGFLVIHDQLSFQNFVTLFIYKGTIDSLVDSYMRIGANKSDLQTSIDRMNNILCFEIISHEIFGQEIYSPGPGNLVISNLSATLQGKPVLRNLNMEIPGGKFVGIVGNSGCGKTTLLKILARQQTPADGKIFIDGHNLFELDKLSFFKCIKLAPQDPKLFSSMSVRDNLKLANPEATDENLLTALQECGVNFIDLDAIVDSKHLSGGEKQRLALARVAVLGAKVILLDESTSALDSKSQEVILQTINHAVITGHTVIMVAHRIQTLKNADIIFRLDAGTVAESGTYSELLLRSSEFRKLANSD